MFRSLWPRRQKQGRNRIEHISITRRPDHTKKLPVKISRGQAQIHAVAGPGIESPSIFNIVGADGSIVVSAVGESSLSMQEIYTSGHRFSPQA